ncbi:MAG: hypothetical protein MI861_23970 [Pirellulales bacterium]|nr:hypothetical protein [Pirellulales bacterium]
MVLPDDETHWEQLSKRRYSSRQRATLEMWRQRDLTRDEVQQAARHPDPEVSGRAKWILQQWRRGALPGTPPAISRLLQRTDDPAVIEELLEAGQFTAAVVAVEESAGTVDRENIQQRISLLMSHRFPVYVRLALQQDCLLDLLKLIDLTATNEQLAVCRVQLMQQLGLPVDQTNLLPTSSETWTAALRDQAKVNVLAILGQLPQATQVARDAGRQDLIRVCQMLSGNWKEMAIETAQLAAATDAGSYEHARLWCQTLVAADRSQQEAIFREAVRQLSISGEDDDEYALDLRWKCLAGHGEVDAALAVLEKVTPSEAALVATASGRASGGFKALGFPLERLEQDIDIWIEQTLQTQRGSGELTEEMRRLFSLMRCLIMVGRDDLAWMIASTLSDSDTKVGSIPLREYVIAALTMTTRRDWMLRLAEAAGEQAFSTTTQLTLMRTLPDSDSSTFDLLMVAIRQNMPRESFPNRLRIVHRLLDGEPLEELAGKVDFKGLFAYLVTARRQLQQLGGRVVLQPRVRVSLNIAQMFSQQGEMELAKKCLQYLVDNGDVEATLELAQRELDGGRAAIAEQLFDLVWQRVQQQSRSGRLRGRSGNADLAAQALVGQWTIAKRSGDQQRAQRLLRQLELTLCSPSTETRSLLARYLGQRGELELSLDAYEILLPMTAFGTSEATSLYQVAWQYSRLAKEVDIASAARWYDLAVGGTLETTDYRSIAYVTLPLDVQRWLLEAAIEQQDSGRTRRHVQRIMQLDPLDIDMAERLLPEMRRLGMWQLADETLTQIIDRGIKHAKRFPFDATSCNNLAWVAAMNGQRLDDALALATQAVDVEPESAIYRDTLAEVLFLLGRKQEALQVEESCIIDDPGQWHLHEQIKKYREALAGEP